MRSLSATLIAIHFTAILPAEEIGYIETFALSPNRQAVLNQLIPGTEDYYYFHCLHYQQTEQYGKVDETLKQWIARFQETPRIREIRHRQALLTYDQTPQATIDYLRKQLKVQFNHQRDSVRRQQTLPTALDQKRVQRETLTQNALRENDGRNLQGFEDAGLPALLLRELPPAQHRDLMRRLRRSDLPDLARHVVQDLRQKPPVSFGSIPIHQALPLDQLDECARLAPELLNNANFIGTYLRKLSPRDGLDWRHDHAEMDAYLTRLSGFTERLSDAQNSLKAHVLFRRLEFNRTAGIFDRELLEQYLKLPRNSRVINPKYLQTGTNQRFTANVNADFAQATRLPPINDDRNLIRSYLAHFFFRDNSYSRYEQYLKAEFLRTVFAETKILNGLGDTETWFAMLNPSQVQELRDRVLLEFDATNRNQFRVDEPVALDLHVKNASTLIVKVFEINTTNYFRRSLAEIDSSINLDGLVPNWETTYSFDESPLRSIRRTFSFPELDRSGVFVIDFIGNGQSSRAVLRKGRLRQVDQITAAGHELTVLNEANEIQKTARVWLDGREFQADARTGTVLIPFSGQPGKFPVVLSSGDFSSLGTLDLSAEKYELDAAFHVNRESLIRHEEASVSLRAALKVNGRTLPLSLLENVRLTIVSEDHDGIPSTTEFTIEELDDQIEHVQKFQVPRRLSLLNFELSGTVSSMRTGKTVPMSAQADFEVNLIETTDILTDVHLTQVGRDYHLMVLGRTGEVLPGRPVTIHLKHRDFTRRITDSLRSDDAGQIVLGPLTGISQIQVDHSSGQERTWTIPGDSVSLPAEIHLRTAEPLELPTVLRGELSRQDVSLLEFRNGLPVRSLFDRLELKRGLLRVTGLPAGNFQLATWQDGRTVNIVVENGDSTANYLTGPNRDLERFKHYPLAISDPTWTEQEVSFTVAGASETTRVHVYATEFVPAFSPFASLSSLGRSRPRWKYQSTPVTMFLTGRSIGDEYRYIIDRRYATKLPGNMLDRPSLLLNPWDVRSTETKEQEARTGGDFDSMDSAAKESSSNGRVKQEEQLVQTDSTSLDFLGSPGVTLLNLAPDKNGQITIDRRLLAGRHMIEILSMDHDDAVSRRFSLSEIEVPRNDLRLARVLPPDQHYTQRQNVSIIRTGESFKVLDLSSSRFETYDSLADVYNFFLTQQNDEHLTEFHFLLQWPELDETERSELYSQYACHEFHLFLYFKDREFFDRVVRPYLASKREPTFLDLWLLEEKLDLFLTPREFARLNTLEKTLLARSMKSESSRTRRYLEDRLVTIPVDRTDLMTSFDTALAGNSLWFSPEESLRGFAGGGFGIGGMGGGGAVGGGGGFFGGGLGVDARSSGMNAPQPNRAADREEVAETEALNNSLKRRRSGQRGDAGEKQQAQQQMLRKRSQLRQMYVPLDRTREWAENNYYQVPLADVDAELIPLNRFWLDFAEHDPSQPFLSEHLTAATSNSHEMLMALAVLDLPFTAGKHDTQRDQLQWTLKAASPVIVFHEQFEQTDAAAESTTILVSQKFFQDSDQTRMVGAREEDKYITDEFLVQTVYGCRVVVTNPSSTEQELDLLLQIPGGALPVNGSRYTLSVPLDLAPYHTEIYEYYFYFPEDGRFLHYPVHVAQDEQLVASAEPFVFNVVDERSRYDTDSWDYISQNGTTAEVIDFLEKRNLELINIERIAFRMRDREFFVQSLPILRNRHVYNDVLWSYSLLHGDEVALREYLAHASTFLDQCGPWLDSSLINIDPVVRSRYEHLDYRPLVNARVHSLGQSRQILNDRLHQQYHALLDILARKRDLVSRDHLEITAYLLLQDRIEEARDHFQQINVDHGSRLQYDYMAAYLDFFNEEPKLARTIAARYADHPVDRWRKRFREIQAQLDEIDGGPTRKTDPLNRDQNQTELAATEPLLDFSVEDRKINLTYQNLAEIEIRYYRMDIELLFSRNPFVQHDSSQFSQIRANFTDRVKLPGNRSNHSLALPEDLQNANLLIEISGGGQVRSRAYYANSLNVQLAENYGQLKVARSDSNRPVPRTYIKVYARSRNGQVRFFKDGYTDLRGRFDYASLSTNQLDQTERLAILILSESDGATVREVSPPRK